MWRFVWFKSALKKRWNRQFEDFTLSVIALHCTTSRHDILPLRFINHSNVVLSGFRDSLALIYHQPFLISKSKLKISGRNNWDGAESSLSGHGLPLTHFFFINLSATTRFGIFFNTTCLETTQNNALGGW